MVPIVKAHCATAAIPPFAARVDADGKTEEVNIDIDSSASDPAPAEIEATLAPRVTDDAGKREEGEQIGVAAGTLIASVLGHKIVTSQGMGRHFRVLAGRGKDRARIHRERSCPLIPRRADIV